MFGFLKGKSKKGQVVDWELLGPIPPSSYIVGGAVRDMILGEPITNINDIDLVTPNPKQAATDLAEQLNATLITLDEERQHYRVMPKDGIQRDFAPLETAIEQDLAQRDFTINALALSHEGKLVDPFSGQQDLQNKIIRMVSYANLQSDPLRCLRAVRFASVLGFNIETDTLDAISNFEQDRMPAAERVQVELSRMLMNPRAGQAMQLLDKTRLLDIYLPELVPAKNFQQGGFHHLDVLQHSFEALNQLVQGFPEVDLATRLATLFHDVGKPASYAFNEAKNRATFYGHDKVGAEITAEVLGRLQYSNKIIDKATKLVRYHMLQLPNSEKSARRFIHKRRELLPDLLQVMISDREAARGKLSTEGTRQRYRLALSTILKLMEEQPPKAPLLNGLEVIELLNIEPSSKVSQSLNFLSEAEAIGDIVTKDDAITALKHFAKAQGW